ncbi:helix-turn-helix domain-containing protein [Sphingobium sp. SCG-1]|uniref:helix-turn-helix domain-containing protein n=1 Tax=Sphingobium sp. SCG-1 TaxID=2072936 RepID=UPI001670B2F3|nr:helix-turn-helix transcriptional regulator [Sphingobium sp. SCG-1]
MARMPESRFNRLTQRQRDCLKLVAQGYTSKEIARDLGISYSTVDNHLLAAMQILEAGSRAEAARLFMRQSENATGQQLPRQPPDLVPAPILADPSVGEPTGWRHTLARLLPPIGGKDNDLTPLQTLAAISRITFFSVLAFIACIMVLRMSITLLS